MATKNTRSHEFKLAKSSDAPADSRVAGVEQCEPPVVSVHRAVSCRSIIDAHDSLSGHRPCDSIHATGGSFHDDGLTQAVQPAVNDLRVELELADNLDPLAFRIVNRLTVSQLHVDQTPHGDRGTEISQSEFVDQEKLFEPRVMVCWEHESLDRHQFSVKSGDCIR